MTAGLPSPTLPLQDPARHASYFFGGYGNNSSNNNNNGNNIVGPAGGNDMREAYLAQGPQKLFPVGPVTPGGAAPYGRAADMPRPMAPAVVRDSVYTNVDTATLASEDGYITDASSKTVSASYNSSSKGATCMLTAGGEILRIGPYPSTAPAQPTPERCVSAQRPVWGKLRSTFGMLGTATVITYWLSMLRFKCNVLVLVRRQLDSTLFSLHLCYVDDPACSFSTTPPPPARRAHPY